MEFISEPITPAGNSVSTADLARGEPSLPDGFMWRDTHYAIVEILDKDRTLRLDQGEKYINRHTWRLRMDDDAVWSVYFVRQPLKGSKPRRKSPRWFLRSIERG